MENLTQNKISTLKLDDNYTHFLHNIKNRLLTAQSRARLAVNSELVTFYWELGKDLVEKQSTYKWGDKFLEQLSQDMRLAFPEIQGFSKRNLEYIRKFAQLYHNVEIAKQPVSQLPWGHIVRLMQMTKDSSERDWYANQATQLNWSRATLEMQIQSKLYKRQAISNKKVSNYKDQLPQLQSNIAHELLKDPYIFDFLTIQNNAHERELEAALVSHIKDFLLELGQGFAFVGSQVPLTFDQQEFFIDLLFYHLKLRCYVVIEIKATKFKPEHTGQLSFYMTAIDDQLRHEHDNRRIGILLCKEKNKIVAEYALRNINAPIGVSEYLIGKSLPKNLKTKLPSIEEIEAELNELAFKKKEIMTDIDEKILFLDFTLKTIYRWQYKNLKYWITLKYI
ncbi:MAG: YhcG family protein [Gammaproteobacteria bacterium]